MAGPSAKRKAEPRFSIFRNPLRLLRQKTGIVPAHGHVFDADLSCNRCGKTWQHQRDEPTACGEPAAEQPLETEPAPDTGGGDESDTPL